MPESFELDEDQEDYSMFAEAELGDKTREFLGTDVGRWLIGCATQQVEECRELALIINPYDEKERFQDNKQKAQAASNFLIWIDEAIGMGNLAHQQILMGNDDE